MPNYDDQPKTRQEKGKGKKISSETPYNQKRVRQIEELLAKSASRSPSMVGRTVHTGKK
jgi:hypothetical protein